MLSAAQQAGPELQVRPRARRLLRVGKEVRKVIINITLIFHLVTINYADGVPELKGFYFANMTRNEAEEALKS